MYSTATSTRYGLPRTTSYSSSSSRYSSTSSSLPPVSTRYTPSRYSTYSTSTASLPRQSTISSRYYPTTSYSKPITPSSSYSKPTTPSSSYSKPITPSYSDYGTSSWKSSSSVSSSPSLPRKSSVTSTSLLTRRPSYTSFKDLSNTSSYYGGRSGSVSSSISSTSNDNYNSRSRSTPAATSYNATGGSEVWVPRSRRLDSTSSTADPEISSPSYSSSQSNSSKLAGRVGLHNLGNTCFMNAVLQCLCHTKPLVDYCMRGSYARDINDRSPNGGKLIKAFTSIINHMWMDNIHDVSPTNLKRELEKYAPRFLGNYQQDAQELLRFLLQGLHEDINKARPVGSNTNMNFGKGLIESRRASASWRLYKNTDDSKIVDLFCGQLKSTLTCGECGNVSVTFDPFWDLSLTIPDGSRITLQKCLQTFSSAEVLDGAEMPVCETCRKKTRCRKQLTIVKCPPILVIHLKRFSPHKLHVLVESPRTLDLSEFVSSYSSELCAGYTLYGIVDHHGIISGGHYTAKCKNPYEEEWNEFNDSRVSQVPSTNLVASSSYLLFYEQGRNSHCSRL